MGNFYCKILFCCCAARGHALAVWLRLVPRRPNALRPWRNKPSSALRNSKSIKIKIKKIEEKNDKSSENEDECEDDANINENIVYEKPEKYVNYNIIFCDDLNGWSK